MPAPLTRIFSNDMLPESADVVVIGGGVAGVSAAYALAKKGTSVALVEKGAISAEQSSRNWGWCRQQNRDPREIPLSQRSLEIWGGLAEEIGADVGFRRTGLIYVTTKSEDIAAWEAWGRIAQQHQVQTRMLTADEAREMTPGSTGKWIGGVHSPTDGRAEPSFAVPALAEAARRLGATLHQECAARGLELTAGRVSGVVTEKGTIRTQAVLCAGGAWAGMFCRHHGVNLPQAGVYSTSFASEPAAEVISGGLSTPKFTIRRRLDGGFTFGLSGRGRVELTPQSLIHAWKFWPTFKKRHGGLSFKVGQSFFEGPGALSSWTLDQVSPFERQRVIDPAADPKLVEEAISDLASLYPALGRLKVAQSWGGLIDSTPDGIPVISPVEAIPGFILAAGFSGHGFGVGPAAGRLAADLIRGDTPIVDPHPYRYSRMIDGTRLGAPGMM